MKKVHNFNSGPAKLPPDVLETAKDELLSYRGIGRSVMEISHRSPEYTEIHNQASSRLKRLLNAGDDWNVLFLTGGASTQFMMVPFNFLNRNRTADYIDTGRWSAKAINEAKIFGNVHVSFSSKDSGYTSVPKQSDLFHSKSPAYLHYTSNNTVAGTQFPAEPKADVPLVCDASSDFLSRPIDLDRFGLIYAGAQKNLGPAGVTVVMVRDSFLENQSSETIPTILNYKTHTGRIFNTPPVFPVYMVNLVLEWIQQKGGIEYFQGYNDQKANLLYNEIDRDDFYRGAVDKDSRSKMNVTFRLHDEDLEPTFIEEAEKKGLVDLKGHRSVGGIRASIYNACDMESVEALVKFMQEFRSAKG